MTQRTPRWEPKTVLRLLLPASLVGLLGGAAAPWAGAQAPRALSEAYVPVASWETVAESIPAMAFFEPQGLAFDLDPFDGQARVLVADSGNDRIQVFDPDGTYLATIGGPGAAPEGLERPIDVALQGSLVFITDQARDRVALFSLEGPWVGEWTGLEGPWGIATAGDGRVAISENRGSRVRIFQSDGSELASLGGFGEGPGQLNRPRGLSFLEDGRLAVADSGNERLVLFDSEGRAIEHAPLSAAPRDVIQEPGRGQLWVALDDGRILRLRDEPTLPPATGPGSVLNQPGLQSLGIGRDGQGRTHLFASLIDEGRPFHGLRHWRGLPPQDADPPEWGDLGVPLGRIDEPFRISAQAVDDASSNTGAWLADRWPRAQRFASNGQALDQIPVPRLNDLLSRSEPGGEGLWIARDTGVTAFLADGSSALDVDAEVDPMDPGAYAWLVALLAGSSADSAASEQILALDIGGQQMLQLDGAQLSRAWSFAPAPDAKLALWDMAAASDGPEGERMYVINRSADSLELRARADGRLLASHSVPGRPVRVASDADGKAFVLNAHGWVIKYAENGDALAAWDAGLGETGSAPSDLSVDAAGRVLVADSGGDRVQVFEPDAGGAPGSLPSFEPRCRATGDKRADPTRLVLGQQTEISLSVRGDCPELRSKSDVVLVIDVSGSMIGDKILAAQDAARIFLAGMDMAGGAEGGRDRAAVVSFNQNALLEAPLTDDPDMVIAAIDGLAAGGGTNIAAGVDAARLELTGPRRRLSAASVIVLLTDGGSAEAPALRASDQAQLEGARLFSIAFGQGANVALLQRMASAPEDFYRAPGATELAEIYAEIARRIRADVLFRSLTVRDQIPANMAFVAGSGEPPPTVDGDWLTWRLSDLPLSGVDLRYRLEPLETGLHPTNVVAIGDGTDGLGQRGQVPFPVPEVEVIAPTPTPSPTPRFTPTPSPTPGPLYLPLLRKDRCVRKQHVDVLLLIDSSNSMLDAAPGGPRKLDAAREAALGFLSLLELEAGDAVGILSFNSEAHVLSRLQQDRAKAQGALSDLRQGPGTRIDLGIRAATAELLGPERNPANQAVLVLLTDGRPNGASREVVLDAGAALSRTGALVYSIGLGQDVDAGLLRQLAGSEQRAYLSPRAEDLERIYAEIAREIPCGN